MAERIRILFIGELHSSHAQSWVGLLDDYKDRFSIQGIALGPIPHDAPYEIHSAAIPGHSLLAKSKRRLFAMRHRTWSEDIASIYTYGSLATQYYGLKKALKAFRPHIVHTFGFTPGALLFGSMPVAFRSGIRWVLQTRGGSDLAFAHADPVWQDAFCRYVPLADVVLCDNLENYRLFSELGITLKKPKDFPFVPGTGGVEIKPLNEILPFAKRERLLLWPKAYECPWSKALPVLEGLRLAWQRIAPVRCVLTAADHEVHNHIRLLPASMQAYIELRERVPRDAILALMAKAKVLLAPSLVDGIPNTLYEAMAAGTIPIVSPLQTLTPHFTEGVHVWYAKNLYPEEIMQAIVKSFEDKRNQDMQNTNLVKVRELADKKIISKNIYKLYLDITDTPMHPNI